MQQISFENDLIIFHTEISSKFQKLKDEKAKNIIDLLKKYKFKNPKDAIIFLFNLSKDEILGQKLISEILSVPRDTYKIIDIFLELLGGTKYTNFFELWLNDEICGYKYAFSTYLNDYWKKSMDLESLVKISPNIAPWALIGKSSELNKDCVQLGSIPSDFCKNIDCYRTLISQIFNSDFYKSFINAKDFETNPEFCKEIAKEIGVLQNDTIAISKKINEDLNKSNNSFAIGAHLITPIIKSFSAKLIFKIAFNNNDYILKINPYPTIDFNKTDRIKKTLENNYLRADMPYINAMVDFYLKLNNSLNAPDILFYDQLTDSSLYKATKTSTKAFEISNLITSNLYLVRESTFFAELKHFGILLNDINEGNFIISDEQIPILIDAGHVSFYNPLRPMVPGYNVSLGNLCGREYMKIL